LVNLILRQFSANQVCISTVLPVLIRDPFAGAYVIYDPEFGWQGFGGDVDTLSATKIKITPRNGPQQRVFIAPSGLWITLDAGRIASVNLGYKNGEWSDHTGGWRPLHSECLSAF
jgi:hypothetical protein